MGEDLQGPLEVQFGHQELPLECEEAQRWAEDLVQVYCILKRATFSGSIKKAD